MGFFKAYDMRGTFGADFDLETVRRVGLALPRVVGGKRWLIGRDCRTTSNDVAAALKEGLQLAGADVYDLGESTTPMVYYFTSIDDYDGSVMITASHNPPSDNGLKVSRKLSTPVGYADGLDKVEELVGGDNLEVSPERGGVHILDHDQALGSYATFLEELTRSISLSGLRYAVDCSNGMASMLVHRLFPGAVVINDTLDGSFPAHSPNPLNPEARKQIASVVRENKLHCGIIFDGDADRAMFVDENGDFVQSDYLIPLVAASCLSSRTSPSSQSEKPVVLHDVRTSRGVVETLEEMGCTPFMVRVGHAFAKPAMRKLSALCGGELAGHYYFGDFFKCDSGILAALRILGEISKGLERGVSFSSLVSPIASRYDNSGEINFEVEDKDAATERVLSAASTLSTITGRSDIDGVRLEFVDGWINVRKSNTEPYLRLVAECRGDVKPWVKVLSAAVTGR
ncbi:MAG: phosphomannomutase/phosphoglucomutase [Kiritimatiellae bacterium]|nr:phosphomannomutase/phosphoglucomutase [Kiritimatiellia bacterium]